MMCDQLNPRGVSKKTKYLKEPDQRKLDYDGR